MPDYNINPANDADSVTVRAAPSADPRLAIRSDRVGHQVGDVIRYTLIATNGGPDTATGVSVHSPLPGTLALVSARPDVGRYDAGRQRWFIGDLPVGVTARLTLRVRVVAEGSIRTRASIEARGARTP